MQALNVIWFRSDLRIHDNPALYNASVWGPCIAVYCLTEKQWEEHDISQAKRSLIVRQLKQLNKQLDSLNIPFFVLNATSYNQIPDILLDFCKDFYVKSLFINHEYEINERKCTDKVSRLFSAAGITTNLFHDQCVVPPGAILNQNGEMFKVFTAFKRVFLKELDDKKRRLYKAPKKQKPKEIIGDISALDKLEFNPRWAKLWPAGEQETHKRLNYFIENRVLNYADNRDIPAIDGTSTLSPYLAIGAISTLQCLQPVMELFEDATQMNPGNGAASWINELIWREFYRHLLHAFPELCKHKPFIANTDKIQWNKDLILFESWCRGETGYPLVDAAMKQLHAWGWMHNRLRMVVAMFLTKHLLIDWRWGEKYFMQHLVDGDLASNNGGWQWSASTGVDAVPWFRIFNPTRQSQRFDPNGKFIRNYLPQLKNLDNKAIHQPSPMEAQLCNYPLPIVDHKIATQSTKAIFKSALSNS